MQIKLNPFLEQYKFNSQKKNQTKEIKVINYGKEITLNIKPLGFLDNMEMTSIIRMSANTKATDDVTISGTKLGWAMLEAVASHVVEIDDILPGELKELGLKSKAEFAEGFFDPNCVNRVYNLIKAFTDELLESTEENIIEDAETAKN